MGQLSIEFPIETLSGHREYISVCLDADKIDDFTSQSELVDNETSFSLLHTFLLDAVVERFRESDCDEDDDGGVEILEDSRLYYRRNGVLTELTAASDDIDVISHMCFTRVAGDDTLKSSCGFDSIRCETPLKMLICIGCGKGKAGYLRKLQRKGREFAKLVRASNYHRSSQRKLTSKMEKDVGLFRKYEFGNEEARSVRTAQSRMRTRIAMLQDAVRKAVLEGIRKQESEYKEKENN